MHIQRLWGVIVVAATSVVACTTLAPADQAGTPKRLKGLGFIAISEDSTGCGLVAEDGGNAAACFGVVKLAEKPRYSYFLLFKVDPKKMESHGIGSRKDSVFGPERGNLHIEVRLCDKKLEFTYKYEIDPKAGTIRESIKIGGKEYDKDVPRVFLVDLTQEKIIVQPVKDARPEPAGGLDKVSATIDQFRAKNAEVKEFFEGKPKM